MAAYVLHRVLWLVPVLLFISIVTFALMHAVPAGPGTKTPSSRQRRQNLNRRYGLDKPV